MKPSLQRSFPIVAAALGRKLGVRVEIHGDTARTDGQCIQIPSIDIDTPATRDIAWGYLAHEAAHLRWTDFDVFRKSATTPLRQALLNVAEDIRVERLMQMIYPGTRRSLERTVERVLVEGGFEFPSSNVHPAVWLQAYCLLEGRASLLGQEILQPQAGKARLALESRVGIDTMREIDRSIMQMGEMASTEEALTLVDRLLSLCESSPRFPEHQPPMVESGDQGEGEGDQTKPQSPHERSPGSDPGLEWASPPISAEDFLRDPFTLAGELLAGDIRQAPGRTLPVADDPPMDSTSNSDLCIRAATQSLGLRRSLEGLVQSSVDRTTRYRQQGHQIEGHRIHRLTIGDTRVFRGVQREQRPNTAIHLLVDRSPSMSALVNTPQGASARRIDLAWEATIALAMALEAIPGVNPGITAFPGDQGESTRVHRILPHGGRLRQVMGRINTDLDGSTPLAEALLYGASVLFGTSESRKVLLVLTDGIPDDLEAAQSVLQDIREAGIEVHGLGLAIDVSSVFGDSVQIANVSELSGRLFDLCRKILIHAH